MTSRSSSLLSLAAVGAVVIRPSLWLTAVRQIARLAPRGWWHRAPFLPIPPAHYLEFRAVTQYGGGYGAQTPTRTQDVVDYLRWCKQWNKTS